MTDTVINIVGHVGTDVDYRQIGSGTELSTFRVASTPRRWDRGQGGYVDGTTTWLTVQCWRTLALHVRDSVRRGDPVIVVGKLKTEEWTKDGVRNSRFILEASAVGHDLSRGVSSFRKLVKPVEASTDESRPGIGATHRPDDVEAAEPIDSPESAESGPYEDVEHASPTPLLEAS